MVMQNTTLIVSEQYHLVYYYTSICLSFISLLGFLLIIIDRIKYNNYSAPIVKCFHPMLFGDIAFTLNYFPYHVYVSIRTALGHENMVDTTNWCRFSWWIGSISLNFQALGLVLIASTPYKMLSNTKNMHIGDIYTVKQVKLFCLLPLIVAILWIVFERKENIGTFKQLYCGPISWNGASGISMLSTSLFCFICIFYFVTSALYKLRKITNNAVFPMQESTRFIKTIQKYTIVMVVSFAIVYGPVIFARTYEIANGWVPIEAEMVLGWGMKLKPFIDCITLYNLRPVKRDRRHRRKQLRASKVSMAKTNLSEDCENV